MNFNQNINVGNTFGNLYICTNKEIVLLYLPYIAIGALVTDQLHFFSANAAGWCSTKQSLLDEPFY